MTILTRTELMRQHLNEWTEVTDRLIVGQVADGDQVNKPLRDVLEFKGQIFLVNDEGGGLPREVADSVLTLHPYAFPVARGVRELRMPTGDLNRHEEMPDTLNEVREAADWVFSEHARGRTVVIRGRQQRGVARVVAAFVLLRLGYSLSRVREIIPLFHMSLNQAYIWRVLTEELDRLNDEGWLLVP